MIPTPFTCGDTLDVTRSLAAYPASAGWVLKVRLVPRNAAHAVVELTGTASGDDHRLQAAASVTGAWSADSYSWASWVEQGALVTSVDAGQTVLLANPRTAAAGTDARSLAERTLADLMAAKAGWDVSAGRQRRYKIGEREMEFNSEADIIQKILFWEGQVAKEQQASNLAKGIRPKNRILTRFVRPR